VKWSTFRNRRVAEIENDELRLAVTQEGGHVAEILHKSSGINPLWVSEWPSIEPSEYSEQCYPEYGTGEAHLVSGMLGHILCLDLFGTPTQEESAAGIPVHGEAAVAPYEISGSPNHLTLRTGLPKAQLSFERTLRLAPDGVVGFQETVENCSDTDRPIGWTQHVTLGAPLLERGKTQFLLSATRSKVYEAEFNNGLCMQQPAAEFEWPRCPKRDGGIDDLTTFTSEAKSGGFTAHQMNPEEPHAYFVAWSPTLKLLIGYVWRREDFPWLSRWEENHLRTWAPWNGKGFALGMEFGVSPMVENRREMVERGKMFGAPTFRWIGARSRCEVKYAAFVRTVHAIPSYVWWDGSYEVKLTF
jgi:hypothetical protein